MKIGSVHEIPGLRRECGTRHGRQRRCRICHSVFEPIFRADSLCPWCKSGNETSLVTLYPSQSLTFSDCLQKAMVA